jgi:hypothetical protein
MYVCATTVGATKGFSRNTLFLNPSSMRGQNPSLQVFHHAHPTLSDPFRLRHSAGDFAFISSQALAIVR